MPSPPRPSFLLIVQLHHLQAMLHLGLVVNPMTGHVNHRDLPKARQELALLEILREKTRGNLTAEEETVLESIVESLGSALAELGSGSDEL